MLHHGNSPLIKLQAFFTEYYKASPGRSVGLDIKWSPLFLAISPSLARSKTIMLLFHCMSADNVSLITGTESVENNNNAEKIIISPSVFVE